MMADDFTPYYCRVGDRAPLDAPYEFGKRVDLVELPFSWNLDDFPAFEYTASRLGVSPGLADPDRVYSIWAGEFDFLYQRLGTGLYTLTMHPQTIGRGHRLLMLEKLLDHIQSHPGVRFRTMGEHAAAWRGEHPLAS
jgi:peptidoglycan/xylan/chitin deacetylase (PgdA/CDA1 family)